MKTRYVTEMGMGTAVHGGDYTQAAERAVFDAIHHSSLHFFAPLEKTADDMFIDLLIGVPEPDKVDADRVAAALPYGTVSITVQKGGLEIPGDDAKDAIIIANAGIVVRLAD
ncbi:MAG: Lin0512 family protein [Pseudomonadales bacterium]